jgi:hypothetical protein
MKDMVVSTMDDDDGDIEECIILKAPSCYYTRDAVVT